MPLTFLSIFRLSHDVLCCATLKQEVIGRRNRRGWKVIGKERRERGGENRMTGEKKGGLRGGENRRGKWRVRYMQNEEEVRGMRG